MTMLLLLLFLLTVIVTIILLRHSIVWNNNHHFDSNSLSLSSVFLFIHIESVPIIVVWKKKDYNKRHFHNVFLLLLDYALYFCTHGERSTTFNFTYIYSCVISDDEKKGFSAHLYTILLARQQRQR